MIQQKGTWARGPKLRKVQDHDGAIIVEKVTNMPHVFYVDDIGNMITLPLTNGQDQDGTDHPAGRVRIRRFEMKGFFPVHECPLHRPDMIRFVDEDLRDAPCEAGDFGRRKMCRHVSKMQERRRDRANIRANVESERYKTWQQRQFELSKKEHDVVVDRLTAEAPKRKMSKG